MIFLLRTNKMKTVIAFSGKMGSGKSYFARQTLKFLRSKGRSARIISIAGKVKKVAATLTNTPISNFYCKKNKEWKYGITNGKLLQILGQGLFSLIDKRLWVDILIDKINRTHEDIIIVDDLRYIHEFDALNACTNIKLFHIHLISPFTRNDGRDTTHPSETECEKIPAMLTIVNNRSQIDIAQVLKSII